jgi:HAD superfamily hydrolase (TIGR01459 family)
MASPLPFPRLIASFEEIAPRYQVFLVDVVGIVHDGVAPHAEAVHTLNQLLIQQKTVIFLSNNPRPKHLVSQSLLRCGLNPGFLVFTSGDLTRFLLTQSFKGQPIFHLGASRNLELTQDLGVQLVDTIAEASLVLLTAFLEEEEDIHELDPLIQTLVEKKIPVLCANPDMIAMHGPKTHRCSGTIAAYIQEKGGEIIFAGKPHLAIYEQLPSVFPDITFEKSKMVMIGDTLETDVLGGVQFQIDTLLVLTGNTGNLLRAHKQELPAYLAADPHRVRPTFFSETMKGRF